MKLDRSPKHFVSLFNPFDSMLIGLKEKGSSRPQTLKKAPCQAVPLQPPQRLRRPFPKVHGWRINSLVFGFGGFGGVGVFRGFQG